MKYVLEVKNVSKNFGGVQALQKCSFYVNKGLITSLIGPNGAGKTTVFNVINGFIKPDEGEVILHGNNITNIAPHKISNLGLTRTFQLPRLYDHLSIEENLLLSLHNPGENFLKCMFHSRKPTKKESEKIADVLKDVGLHKDLSTEAGELSYGQKRLLEIARALLKEHEVLLLDEPTAGVNPKLRMELKKILRKLRKKGKTILLIEHDMEFVMDLSDEVIVMDAGKKLVADRPDVVRNDPKVLEAYLGD